MNRHSMYALILIALLVVAFIFNRGTVDVNLIVVKFSMLKALAFLMFTALGVLIGVWLK